MDQFSPPDDEKFSNGEITHIFLRDDAFALKGFMTKPFPWKGLTGERQVYIYLWHSRKRRIPEKLFQILANRWRIFFTTINLEPKYVKDVSFADCILEDVEVSEVECRTNVATDSFYSLQLPRMCHNTSLYAQSIREKFIDYFVNDGAVER